MSQQEWAEVAATPTYPSLVRHAAERYRAVVAALADRSTGGLREAAALLLTTLDRALRLGPALTPSDVQVGEAVFAAVPEADWSQFVNEWVVGLGADKAPVIVMGTEVADTLKNPTDVAYLAGFAMLALCGGRLDVTHRLLVGPKWDGITKLGFQARPYTVHSYDVFPPGRGQHTWGVLARVVAPDHDQWRTLLKCGGPSPSLGDLTYQIERSAFPSKQRRGGHAPTPARLSWLVEEVMPTLRESARVLLLHGGGGRTGIGWELVDLPLIRSFLGMNPRASVDMTWEQVRQTELGHIQVGARVAVSSRGLSMGVSGDYIARLRAIVVPHING